VSFKPAKIILEKMFLAMSRNGVSLSIDVEQSAASLNVQNALFLAIG
jgi:hypothetical protein